MSPYECGVQPVGDARQRFSVKFYLVAMLFILFDVEAVFLYPWAVILRELKMFGFWEMMVYIGIVLVGSLLCLEKGRDRLGSGRHQAGRRLMALAPPITDIEQLKSHPALARLVEWNASLVQAVKFDRDELTIWIEKDAIREACAILRDAADCPFNYLADLTCVDWYPSEPRFEVVYHLLSIPHKERVRLKVRLDGSSPAIESRHVGMALGQFL